MFIASVIIKSNCRILQFLHQMFNVSALLLDDALLKCVVSEVLCRPMHCVQHTSRNRPILSLRNGFQISTFYLDICFI